MQELARIWSPRISHRTWIGERMILPPRARGLRIKFSEIQLIDMNRTHKDGQGCRCRFR